MTATPKFVRGEKVKVKGMKGNHHTIHWPVLLPVPVINSNRFDIEIRVAYKFIEGQYTFYAWETDLTKVK